MYTPNYTISDALLNKVAEIESYRSRIGVIHILPEREVELRYRATVEATHSSIAIEGNPLSAREVGRVLSDQSGKPLTRHRYAEIEAKNYKRALDFIEKRKRTKEPVTLEDILTIHAHIAEGLLPAEKAGALRKNEVYIAGENDEVVYEATPAELVPQEVRELLEWLNSSENIHPVIASAVLHFQLVGIHPFADGNGRTVRALTALYLGIRDYDFDGELVLDSYYASDRAEYYEAISPADNYQERKMVNLNPWINYFSDGFLSSIKVLSAEITLLSTTVGTVRDYVIRLDEADLLSYAKQFGAISLSEAEEILPHLSRRTVQRKLKDLADKDYLVMKGSARDTRYEWRESSEVE